MVVCITRHLLKQGSNALSSYLAVEIAGISIGLRQGSKLEDTQRHVALHAEEEVLHYLYHVCGI